MLSFQAMKSQDIQKLMKDAQDAYGSANANLLGRLVSSLMAVIHFLLTESSRKDEELAGLRNKVFGSSSEKMPRADELQETASKSSEELENETNSDVKENQNYTGEPAAGENQNSAGDPAAGENQNSAGDPAAEAQRIKAMRAEARKIARKMKKKVADTDEAKKIKDLRTEARRLAKIMAQADEMVRRRVPNDLPVRCPVCGDTPKDAGLCRRAQEIDVLPSQFIKRQYLLHKAVCSCGALGFVMPGPIRGVEKTNYSPRFIARLIYDKFQNSLPATRQAKDMKLQGLNIHRNSLIRLLIKAHLILAPVAQRIRELNQQQSYQHCDESPVTMVIKGKKVKRWLWCLISEQAISFDISNSRNKETAREIIGSTPGVLTADGLNIYHDLINDKIEGGCLAHLRRKFWYALPSFPDEAMQALRLIGEVYDVEHEANDENLSPEERLKLRQKKSLPIMERLRAFTAGIDPPPRSGLAGAASYLDNHWQALTYFTKDGRVRPDNNIAEGALRLPKLGFKNFMFAQSELGSKAIADFYTILASCIKHGNNPLEYLTDVITRLNCNWKMSRLDELLPWNWQQMEVHGPFYIPSREEVVPAPQVIDLARAKASRRRNQANA